MQGGLGGLASVLFPKSARCFSRPPPSRLVYFRRWRATLSSSPVLVAAYELLLSASAQMHSIEPDADLSGVPQALAFIRVLVCQSIRDLTCTLDLFRSSVGESLQIYDRLLRVYSHLLSVCSDISEMNASGGGQLRR